MSLSLLLQQSSASLVRLIWIVFEIDGRWPYSSCFVECCLRDLFNTARSILAQLPSSLVSFHVVYPYSSIETTSAFYLIG